MRTLLAVAVSAWLSIGCAGPKVIPDPTIPHRVAKPGHLVVWGRLPSGQFAEVEVEIPAGWWVAGPLVVEGP